MLTFAQNSFVFSTRYFLSPAMSGDDRAGRQLQHRSQYAASAGTLLHLIVFTMRADHRAEHHSSAADRQAPADHTYFTCERRAPGHGQARASLMTIMARAGTVCHRPAPTSIGGLGPGEARGDSAVQRAGRGHPSRLRGAGTRGRRGRACVSRPGIPAGPRAPEGHRGRILDGQRRRRRRPRPSLTATELPDGVASRSQRTIPASQPALAGRRRRLADRRRCERNAVFWHAALCWNTS